MKPPAACYHLVNKAFYFPPPMHVPLGEEGIYREALTTPFTCLRTHEPIGPDGADVSLEDCACERPCYQPEVDI